MRYYVDAGILTLQAALFDHMNSEDLRKLGALTKQKLPTRKGDLRRRYPTASRGRPIANGLADSR